jgi:hypothetical protein
VELRLSFPRVEGGELEDKEVHGRGDHHGDWNKQRDLEHGKFSYQLILDDGAEEILIMPTADDAKVLGGFVDDADAFYGDTKHEVLIFRKID